MFQRKSSKGLHELIATRAVLTGITIGIIEHVLRVILSLVKRLVVLQRALLTDGVAVRRSQ
jgi:ABC-type branched-subunit amino acid transport system ATPase component